MFDKIINDVFVAWVMERRGKGSIKIANNGVIAYSITRVENRDAATIVLSGNSIEVKAPMRKTDAEIRDLVISKIGWIIKNQLRNAGQYNATPKVDPKIKHHIENRVWELSKEIDVTPTSVAVKRLKTRWGSCSRTGMISINSALAKAPIPVLDYIIINCLCHLKFPHQSRPFWALVSRYCKNYEQQIRWLESNGASIM